MAGSTAGRQSFIVYIDDSGDEKLSAFSALLIPAHQWRAAFDAIKAFRRQLRDDYGIYVKKELHAWKFISGRGRIAPTVINKTTRAKLFLQTLEAVAHLPDIRIINACSARGTEITLFERLLNRINVAMGKANGVTVIMCDEGKEGPYTKLARKIAVHNPIPSKFLYWPTGEKTKNIPTEHIIEDLVFKDSRKSYFIQLADFCAFALLRRERPTPKVTQLGLDKAFFYIAPVCVKEAYGSDPFGIIRA